MTRELNERGDQIKSRQMDEGDRTQHAATGRCATGVRITLLPGLAWYKPYHRGG